MNIHQFELAFGPVIRSLFNTKRAKKEQWKVQTKIITSRKKLGKLQTTWYQGSLLDDNSKRYRIDSVSDGNAEVLKLAAQMAASSRKYIVLAVPAYKNGKDIILLDGNHRCAAIYTAKIPFSLIVFLVKGPTDERGLWDLASDV